VTPQSREPTEPVNHGPVISYGRHTEDDTINLIELPRENIHRFDDSDIEILNEIHNASSDRNEDIQPLEPLDPDVEYRQTITHLFVNLDQYARSIFDGLHSE